MYELCERTQDYQYDTRLFDDCAAPSSDSFDQPIAMFASNVTMDGIRVTAVSLQELAKWLLNKSSPFKHVQTGSFGTQDFLEVIIYLPYFN